MAAAARGVELLDDVIDYGTGILVECMGAADSTPDVHVEPLGFNTHNPKPGDSGGREWTRGRVLRPRSKP